MVRPPQSSFSCHSLTVASGLAERGSSRALGPPERTPARDPRKGQEETKEPSFDHTASRVHTLISEGSLRRACTALTYKPPVIPTSEVVDELRRLQPGPTASHLEEINKLRAVSPGAVPAVDPDMVRKALSSFAPTSGAGPSGAVPRAIKRSASSQKFSS